LERFVPVNDNIVELRNISFVRQNKKILQDIDLSVQSQTCTAILGPNGSGKSTLIALIAGYIWPTTGNVSVFGNTFGKVNLNQLRKNVGIIEPSRMPSFIPYYTLRQIVATGLFGTIILPANKTLSDNDTQKVDFEIASMGLSDLADTRFTSLSTGEQTKTLIARAIVSNAKLLILDEPTVGLDIAARANVVNALDKLLKRKHPPTIIIVSHHLDELPSYVDKVVLLKQGRILFHDTPEKTLTSENLSAAFDCSIKVAKNNYRFVAWTDQ
jgi:iron complex transport system ATP-binding protein